MLRSKDVFFEKKQQKAFDYWAEPIRRRMRRINVFRFFFSKKNCFLRWTSKTSEIAPWFARPRDRESVANQLTA
jgi:hypothetical protein